MCFILVLFTRITIIEIYISASEPLCLHVTLEPSLRRSGDETMASSQETPRKIPSIQDTENTIKSARECLQNPALTANQRVDLELSLEEAELTLAVLSGDQDKLNELMEVTGGQRGIYGTCLLPMWGLKVQFPGPFETACMTRRWGMATLMLQFIPNPQDNIHLGGLLRDFIRRGDQQSAIFLIKSNVSPNGFAMRGMSLLDCETLLNLAIRLGLQDLFDVMIEYEVDVNACDLLHTECKNTPIMTACVGGYVEMVEKLIDQGACVHDVLQTMDRTPVCGKSPLEYARQQGHAEVVALLDGKLQELSDKHSGTQ